MDISFVDHGVHYCGDREQERTLNGEDPLTFGRCLTSVDSVHTKHQETVIVFDWDDTLLPTSWLERIHALSAGAPLRPDMQRQILALTAACASTLHLAATLGTVVIVTNSAPGWLDQSCQLFMPQLCQHMRGFQVFAKPSHAPLTFKMMTFQRECRQYRNVISVGDGDAERVASLRLQAGSIDRKKAWQGEGDAPRCVKSVKLIELPTCQQLVQQQEMLQVRLPDIVAFKGNLDLKARMPVSFGAGVSRAASGCSLVHFSRHGGTRSVACPGEDVRVGTGGRTLPPVLRPNSSTSQLPLLGHATAPAGGIGSLPGTPAADDRRGVERSASESRVGTSQSTVSGVTGLGDFGERDFFDAGFAFKAPSGGTGWLAAHSGPGKARLTPVSSVTPKGGRGISRERGAVTAGSGGGTGGLIRNF
mmetsp:Transcript_54366/g.129550  ORF Transcript_54366/g.129550 Transcript_54366/m.129550 type:complete len:419 (+) Transcript_54366:68-1324(+)